MVSTRSNSLAAILAAFLAFAAPAAAANFSFTGTFTQDDNLAVVNFSIAAPSNVVVQSWGYGGGVNGAAQNIPIGGFDPIVFLFDSTGTFIGENDDGDCPPATEDPNTNSCYDSQLVLLSLAQGSYTLVLAQFGNRPGPTLTDPFLESGNPFYTGQFFLGQDLSFIDSNLDQRNGNWAFDVSGVDTAEVGTINYVPEPDSIALLFGGLAGIAVTRRWSQKE